MKQHSKSKFVSGAQVHKGKPFDRIRKDYNDLTKAERELYIKAVQTAKKEGKYDIFVALHKHVNLLVLLHNGAGLCPYP